MHRLRVWAHLQLEAERFLKYDPQISRFLRAVWPPGHRVSFWSARGTGKAKGFPWTGSAAVDVDGRTGTRIEWELGKASLGAYAHLGDESGLAVHFAVPLVSLFADLPLRRFTKLEERVLFDVRLIEDRLHWKFGGKDGTWNSSIPRWREGGLSLRNALLGKPAYAKGKSDVHRVKIPMPEGCYDATIEVSDDVWTRSRWLPRRARMMRINVPLGIPHQGKGENDYDLGEDALFGWGGPCPTIEEAIGRTVTDALHFRQRYDPKGIRAVYPSPKTRAERLAKERKAAPAAVAKERRP